MKTLYTLCIAIAGLLLLGCGNMYGQDLYVTEGAYGSPRLLHVHNGVPVDSPAVGNLFALPQGIDYNATSHEAFWVDQMFAGAQVRTTYPALTPQDSLYPGDASLSSLNGIALDTANNRMFWTSSNLQNGSALYQAALDGSNRTNLSILQGGDHTTSLRGIALNASTGILYMTNDGAGQILRYNIQAHTLDTLISGLTSPVGVAIDATAGHIYWTQSTYATGKIYRANLSNGSAVTALYSNLNEPNFVSVEPISKKLFWTQLNSGGQTGTILEANEDGSSPSATQVGPLMNEPNGIVVSPTYAAESLTLGRACINFGTAGLNSAVNVALSITNSHTSATLVDSFKTDNPAFKVTAATPIFVDSNSTQSVQVTFTPTTSGMTSGTLTIYAEIGTYTVSLTGQGQIAPTGPGYETFTGLVAAGSVLAPKYSVVGAYLTNGSLIQAALVSVPPESIAENAGTNYTLTLSDGQAGLAAGDTIVFDVTTLDCSTLIQQLCTATAIYTPGTSAVQFNVVGVQETSLGLPLLGGYNAVSWNVAPADSAITSIFAGPLSKGLVNVILSYQNDGSGNPQFNYYIPELGRYSTLQTTSFTKGYLVYMASSAKPETVSVAGVPVCPGFPIPLNGGYNLVSYLEGGQDQPQNAFASLIPNNLNIALRLTNDGQGNNAFDFYPNGGFVTTSPGEGYFLYTDSADVLMYPGAIAKPAPRTHRKNSSASRSRIPLSENGSLPQAVIAYGMHVMVDGKPVPVGSSIKAVNESGAVCGSAKFVSDGVFSMPIYRANAATPKLAGAQQGENLKIYVNDSLISQRVKWTSFGDTPRLDGPLSTNGASLGSQLPKKFALYQNMPNPFNPTTNIKYDLPVASKVRLTIYNVLGQVVDVLTDATQSAGSYQPVWNANNFSSGVYFYRIEAVGLTPGSAKFVSVNKMVLMK